MEWTDVLNIERLSFANKLNIVRTLALSYMNKENAQLVFLSCAIDMKVDRAINSLALQCRVGWCEVSGLKPSCKIRYGMYLQCCCVHFTPVTAPVGLAVLRAFSTAEPK